MSSIHLAGTGAAAVFDVVALGASLGGLRALTTVLASLPTSFPAAVLVVQHRAPSASFGLADLLARASALPLHEAEQGEPLQPGHVVLAPAGLHMTVTPERTIALSEDSKVQFSRPSIDVLFHSVAEVHGVRAIAVVLTGRQSDGAAGSREIKRHGGRVFVQDEASSMAPEMPRAAMATGCVDFVLPLESLASALVAFTMVHGAAELFRVPAPAWATLQGRPR